MVLALLQCNNVEGGDTCSIFDRTSGLIFKVAMVENPAKELHWAKCVASSCGDTVTEKSQEGDETDKTRTLQWLRHL